MLLRQLRDKHCVKVIIAKPCGSNFQAMVKAQRRNGILPDKLMEMDLPQGLHQTPLPDLHSGSAEPASFVSQEASTLNTTNSPSHTRRQVGKTGSTQATKPQLSELQASGIPASISPAPTTLASTTPTPDMTASMIPPSTIPISATQSSATPGRLIPRNRSGQRVDPRVDALAWLVSDARSRRICYEYHLHGQCLEGPPCPRVHSTSNLNIHQLNALQVLARETPCSWGNTCADWSCCFGHRCQFGGRCNRGMNCRFPASMHFMDTKVVDQ